jgi:hypothetical protein
MGADLLAQGSALRTVDLDFVADLDDHQVFAQFQGAGICGSGKA